MSYTLRVGRRAVTASQRPVRFPIEGARAVMDRGAIVVLIGYRDPSPDECEALETEPVGLAVVARDAAVSLLVEVGNSAGPGYLSCAAPVNLLDPDAEPDAFLVSDGAVPIRFALCDSKTGLVRALRTVCGPADVVQSVRTAGRLQVDTLGTDRRVRESVLRVLNGDTIPALMAQATRRVCA